MFHDQAYAVLHFYVLGSAASLHLWLHRVLLVLDVLQGVLNQVTYRPMLGRVQRLDVLQDVEDLEEAGEGSDTSHYQLGKACPLLCTVVRK